MAKKIIFLSAIIIFAISCRKKAWEQPDVSGKKCWECEMKQTFKDTIIVTNNLSCNKTEIEIRQQEKDQSINNCVVTCKEKK